MNCKCDSITYTPICDIQTNITHFSPCHAGCKSFDAKQNIYNDCSCTRDKAVLMKSMALDKYSQFNETYTDKIRLVNHSLDINNNFIERDIHIDGIYTPGACENNCDHDFIIFSFIGLFVSLLTSTGRIGTILVEFR